MRKVWSVVLAAVAAVGGWFGLTRGNVPKLEAMPAPVVRLVVDTLYVAIAPVVPNIEPPNALDSAVVDHTTSGGIATGPERRRYLGPVFPVPVADTFRYYVGALAPASTVSGSLTGRTYRGTKSSGASPPTTWSYTLPGVPVDTMPPPGLTIPPPTIIAPDSVVGTLPDSNGWYGLQLWVKPRELQVMASTPACIADPPDLAACRQAVMDSLPTVAERQKLWGCGFVGHVDTGQTWTLQYHVGSYPAPGGDWGNCDTFLAATNLTALVGPLHHIRTNIETGVYLASADNIIGRVARMLTPQ